MREADKERCTRWQCVQMKHSMSRAPLRGEGRREDDTRLELGVPLSVTYARAFALACCAASSLARRSPCMRGCCLLAMVVVCSCWIVACACGEVGGTERERSEVRVVFVCVAECLWCCHLCTCGKIEGADACLGRARWAADLPGLLLCPLIRPMESTTLPPIQHTHRHTHQVSNISGTFQAVSLPLYYAVNENLPPTRPHQAILAVPPPYAMPTR